MPASFRRCLFFPFVLAVCLFASAPAHSADPKVDDLSQRISNFYQDPTPLGVARVLADFDKVGPQPGAVPPLIGFLSAAFKAFPSEIGQMIPEGMQPRMRGYVAIALRMAGKDRDAAKLVEGLRDEGVSKPDLSRYPPDIDLIMPRGPADFDLLWGASFASGDPKYCRKILARYVAFANEGDNVADMVAILASRVSKADLRPMLARVGEAKFRELVDVSTALWSLDSNAKQHDFVRKEIDVYISAHPKEPAAFALFALRGKAKAM